MEQDEKDRYVSETQKQSDEQIAYKRRMNMKYWQAKLKASRTDVQVVTAEQSDTQRRDKEHVVQSIVDELDQLEREQVESDEYGLDMPPTESSLGVFGVPLEAGAFYSLDDGGYRPELDDHTLPFPTAGPFDMRGEVKRVELMDAQSRVMALEEKLETLRVRKANAVDDRKTVLEKKESVVRGMTQAKSDHREILASLAGPPRREPREVDRRQIHSLLTLQSDLNDQLKDLSVRERLINERLGKWAEEEAALLMDLDDERALVREKEAEVDERDRRENELPMVVGRSIAHAAQERLEDAFLPKETMTYIRERTKLELLKAAAIPAFQLYEEARTLGIESWKLSKQKIVDEAELELSMQRLAKIKDSLTQQQSLNQRSDVINALQKFHNNSEALYHVKKVSKGALDWWKTRDANNSLGVSLGESNGIVLDAGNRRGILRGACLLPSHSLWKLRFQIDILQRDNVNIARFSQEDRIRVSFGSTSGSVGQMGSFMALDDYGKLHLGHAIDHEYVGARLYYCFEFSRSYESMASNQCLALFGGAFEEDETADAHQNAVHMGTHVLSEYVKMLRVQAQQGNHRCATLLEELIKVEASDAAMWDSKVLHGHAQRFPRLAYATQVREAIQNEISKAIQQDINKRRLAYVEGGPNALVDDPLDEQMEVDDRPQASPSKAAEQRKRLEQSMLDYRHRKSEHIEQSTKAARDVVGQRLELFENEQWVPGLIESMRVEWKEGGTKLDISHLVTFKRVKEGSVERRWMCLKNEKFVFVVNDMAPQLVREREKKIEEEKIIEAEVQAKKIQAATKTLLEIEQEYVSINSKEDLAFEKAKERDVRRREIVLRNDAHRTCTYDPQVVSLLEVEARRLMQNINHQNVNYEMTLRALKDNFIKHTVDARMEFIRKTWNRKNKRRLEKRKLERDQRRRKYEQSNQRVQEISKKELLQKEMTMKKEAAEAEVVAMATALRAQLRIPNFDLAVASSPPCSHRDLKSWGSKYDQGRRCKVCGKEVSHIFDEEDVARGADPALDRDVEKHRLNEVSFRFTNAAHLKRVEDERLRLEKEAREIQLAEVQSYDSTHMKAIEAFNFRHLIDRNVDDRDETRNDRDRHVAAYRDELSFFARVNQYRYRLQILFDLRGATYRERLLELENLDQLQCERERAEGVVVVVQIEQERARQLLKDRNDAIDQYNVSAKHLQDCLVEKTLALRAREGVEEEAKIAMLHAAALERTSLKMRLLWDVAHEERQKVKEVVRTTKEELTEAVTARQALTDGLLALQYRKKGTQVFTPYGVGHVNYFREADAFLVIRLRDWKATAFIPLKVFVQQDKASQQRERLAMDRMEVEMRMFVQEERRREEKERMGMAVEEEMCQEVAAWAEATAAKEQEIRLAVTKCEMQAQVRLALKAQKLQFRKDAQVDAVRAHSAKLRIHRPKLVTARPTRVGKPNRFQQTAIAPEAPRPSSPPKVKKQKALEKKRLARVCHKRLVMDHVEEEILATEAALVEKYDRAHHEQLVSTVGNACVTSLLHELLGAIAEEALAECQETALSLELQSTIVYSKQYPHIQAHVHAALQRQAMGHKLQLEVVKRTWARQMERLRRVQAEVARRREIERLAEEERKRLEELCKEMAREEMFCRRFYREEKRRMLMETRGMQIAEMEMREYMRLVELQLMLDKYNALGLDDNKESSKQARRLQIKKGKREKQRLAEEWAAIKQEDELATAIREVYLQEAREKKLEQQQLEFMLQQAEFQDSDSEDDVEFGGNHEDEPHEDDAMAAKAKEMLDHLDPKAWAKVEAQLERRARAKAVAARKRQDFVHKLNEEYMMAAAETLFGVANADLQLIEINERLGYFQRLDKDAEQIKAMQLDLKRNQKQAKEISDGAKKKQAHAMACIARCQAAEAALELAIVREKRDEQFMGKMIRDTKYMDSSVVHKRCQRFLTDFLAKELYRKYFQTLVDLLLLRTYTVSGERHLVALSERIQSLDRESADKSVQVTKLWKQHTRASRMRLSRAELGRLFFRKHRKMALKMAFQGWLKVWHQAHVVRHAYELRYSLARQDHRLNALEKMHESGTHLEAKREASPAQTVLHKFQHRWLQCRLCKTKYSEAQNNRFACTFHPETYERACVKSCPSRRGEPLQANCMLHRANRWLCCDQTNEGAFGSTGCKRRFHLPTRNDPQTVVNLEAAEAQEKAKLTKVNQDITELESKSVSRTVYRQMRDQLQEIQSDLADQREKASRYDLYHKS
ncbi:Aste57867_23364 [Aphanomyces stellatus]|uniref:Aste57867_23364 protein n=1 Tax=Aphanomyces stellatus TaxID=120398 RepID=A0A485LNB1_9STRA|nr:hypothetical protein As57867_023293 [Aphanomyces stellatus]VFU00010.1 Aste57867_23364 [Aphanomyces stellatus]